MMFRRHLLWKTSRGISLVGLCLGSIQQYFEYHCNVHESLCLQREILISKTGLHRAPKALEARAILSSTSVFISLLALMMIPGSYLKLVAASMASFPMKMSCMSVSSPPAISNFVFGMFTVSPHSSIVSAVLYSGGTHCNYTVSI